MNHNYSAAIELNASGVYSLQHHKYEEATSFFCRALSVLKNQEQGEHEDNQNTPCSAATQGDIAYELNEIELYKPSRTVDKFQRHSPGSQDPMIVKMAIGISGAASSTTSQSQRANKWVARSVIYNLATTTHLRGLESGSTDQLQKAMQLYEMVCRIHQVDDAAGPNNSLGTVLAAALNNAASIHVVLGNHELAIKFLQPLMATMTFYCSPAGEPTTKYEQSWRICRCNILMLLVSPPSTAGAA